LKGTLRSSGCRYVSAISHEYFNCNAFGPANVLGGALALLALCTSPEVDAGVVWYGCPPLEHIDATKIQAKLQGHWATQDEFFPIAGIDRLQDKLRKAGVTFDFHRYLARHAFANGTAGGPGRIPQTQYDRVWPQQA
jgi:carboxymethylenebutenolidase